MQFCNCELSPDESSFMPAANITSTLRFSLSFRDLNSAWVLGCCEIMSKTDFMTECWALAPSWENLALNSTLTIEIYVHSPVMENVEVGWDSTKTSDELTLSQLRTLPGLLYYGQMHTWQNHSVCLLSRSYFVRRARRRISRFEFL